MHFDIERQEPPKGPGKIGQPHVTASDFFPEDVRGLDQEKIRRQERPALPDQMNRWLGSGFVEEPLDRD